MPGWTPGCAVNPAPATTPRHGCVCEARIKANEWWDVQCGQERSNVMFSLQPHDRHCDQSTQEKPKESAMNRIRSWRFGAGVIRLDASADKSVIEVRMGMLPRHHRRSEVGLVQARQGPSINARVALVLFRCAVGIDLPAMTQIARPK